MWQICNLLAVCQAGRGTIWLKYFFSLAEITQLPGLPVQSLHHIASVDILVDYFIAV